MKRRPAAEVPRINADYSSRLASGVSAGKVSTMDFLTRACHRLWQQTSPASNDWQAMARLNFAIAHYFAFTSMMPDDAGCSAVAGCPDMG